MNKVELFKSLLTMSIRKAAEKHSEKYTGKEKEVAYKSFLEGMYYAADLLEK